MSEFTSILFPESSYLSGCASVLDIGGTLTEYNERSTPQEADLLAVWADWMAVGKDLSYSIEQYRMGNEQ